MADYSLLKQRMDECGIEYRLMEDLKNHTTFKIGGNADIFAVPHSIGELSFLLKTAVTSALISSFMIKKCPMGTFYPKYLSRNGTVSTTNVRPRRYSRMPASVGKSKVSL